MPKAFLSDQFLDELARERGGSIASAIATDGALNLDSALSSWVDSLDPTKRNHIVIHGDSNTQWDGRAPYRWAQQLRDDILAFTGMADGGPGVLHLYHHGASTSGQVSKVADAPFYYGLLEGRTVGPHGLGWVIWPGASWTLTTPEGMADWDRFCVYGAGDFTYSVDGAAATPVGQMTPVPGAFATSRSAEISAAGATLTIGGDAPLGGLFEGVGLYNGTTGLVVHNLGMFGGATRSIAGDNGDHMGIFEALQPKLTIFWVGTNDFNAFAPHREWEHYYRIAVERARKHGDVLMVYPMARRLGGGGIEAHPRYSHEDYQQVMRTIAWETDSGYLSIAQALGPWERANARGHMKDHGHLSEKGHGVVRRIIKRALELHS